VLEVNRASALKALDDAMVDEMRIMVSVLVRGFESDDKKSTDRFRNGLKIHNAAYAVAEQAIKDLVGE
jgi:hypothetical protein